MMQKLHVGTDLISCGWTFLQEWSCGHLVQLESIDSIREIRLIVDTLAVYSYMPHNPNLYVSQLWSVSIFGNFLCKSNMMPKVEGGYRGTLWWNDIYFLRPLRFSKGRAFLLHSGQYHLSGNGCLTPTQDIWNWVRLAFWKDLIFNCLPIGIDMKDGRNQSSTKYAL